MARTPLLRLIRRGLRAELAARKKDSYSLTRREFLQGAAAVAVTASLPYTLRADAQALKGARIGIIGAGVSGLTIAYRLMQAGLKPQIFEAAGRVGGRMFTQRQFNRDDMFCELGGELVDSDHEALRGLCGELGVGLQSLRADDAGEDLFYFGGHYYRPKDVMAGFAPLAARIARDQQGLEDSDGWTEKARALDRQSLRSYLDGMQGLAPEWVMTLLEVAYTIEYGLPLTQQSALNLVCMIGTEPEGELALFGDSDEAWRIRGGSSTLTDALAEAVKAQCDLRTQHVLTHMERRTGEITCTFSQDMQAIQHSFDRVIVTLPFSSLRKVTGLEALGLSELKHTAIRELGYGTNAKIMMGTTSRPWRGNEALPAPSNGSFLTDMDMQCSWETSRGQAGACGILVNYLGGAQGKGQPAARLRMAEEQFNQMIPGIAEAWDVPARSHFFWAEYPLTRGSYTCAKPGQYTTLLDAAGTTELEGRLLFAGEHTSVEYNGYMNGAVESAERVARELLSL